VRRERHTCGVLSRQEDVNCSGEAGPGRMARSWGAEALSALSPAALSGTWLVRSLSDVRSVVVGTWVDWRQVLA